MWHADARLFDIADARGQPVGSFYLDRLRAPAQDAAAPGWTSASGASTWPPGRRCRWPTWCATSCPPGEARPALLTHDDVLTLFHEFGHGLHHLLTRVDYPSIAGINGVAWDAVELPSQFLENYAWHPDVLRASAATTKAASRCRRSSRRG